MKAGAAAEDVCAGPDPEEVCANIPPFDIAAAVPLSLVAPASPDSAVVVLEVAASVRIIDEAAAEAIAALLTATLVPFPGVEKPVSVVAGTVTAVVESSVVVGKRTVVASVGIPDKIEPAVELRDPKSIEVGGGEEIEITFAPAKTPLGSEESSSPSCIY